jgi:SAM-dependent methyltransferase
MSDNLYDDPAFFAGYSQLARSREGLAGAPEWPALRAMLPPLEGKHVLDLGCGFGAFARWARKMGAVDVIGIDASEKMLARARSLTRDPNVTFRIAAIERLDLPPASVDLVYSSLVLHYIEDFAPVAAALRAVLVDGGYLVASVEHPLFTAPRDPHWQTGRDGSNVWPLTDYLKEGRRVTDWITSGVVKYHRTVAGYVNALVAQGFVIMRLEEWAPNQKQIAEHPEWADEVHRPPFLLLSARA